MMGQRWDEPIAGEVVGCHFPDDVNLRPKARPALVLTVFDDDAPRFHFQALHPSLVRAVQAAFQAVNG